MLVWEKWLEICSLKNIDIWKKYLLCRRFRYLFLRDLGSLWILLWRYRLFSLFIFSSQLEPIRNKHLLIKCIKYISELYLKELFSTCETGSCSLSGEAMEASFSDSEVSFAASSCCCVSKSACNEEILLNNKIYQTQKYHK